MASGLLLIQARRTAGLSQRALAARAGVAQQEIARYERGRVRPSLERLQALIAACGLELTLGLTRADFSYDGDIARTLAVSPVKRLTQALRDADRLESSVRSDVDQRRTMAVDALGVLRSVSGAGVRFVLVGEVAEVLRGSPVLPLTRTVTAVPQLGQASRITDAIESAGGCPASLRSTPVLDAPITFNWKDGGARLILDPAPAGTRGYEDLRRDATEVTLGDTTVDVASLLDLLRIAEASEDRARVPALRRTLELASSAAASHVA